MIKSDEPIRNPEDDQLGRANLAAVIAGEIRNIDASEGFVVGVLGPWGSGKTSLINLIRTELSKEPAVTILEFNPWMFSGTDQLIERFFVELSEQLGHGPDKLDKVADLFAQYSKVLTPLKYLPIASSLFEGAKELGEAIKALLEERKGGVEEHRQRLREALGELNKPIVVVIDDVDRLSTNEIRDVFKLVRLTANFPKVIYIVAFDRSRVEHALTENGLSGRDYLEKIIQAAYDMPAIPPLALRDEMIAAINHALADVENPGPFDEDRWAEVLLEIVQPLFRSVRDVRRYAASLAGSVRSLDGKVALVDVLGLEAVRVFMPDIFASICQNQEALTSVSGDLFDELADPGRKEAIAATLERAGVKRNVAEAVIERLFPAAIRHLDDIRQGSGMKAQWARERRVTDPHVLAYFCERVAGSRLQGHWAAERMAQVIGDKDQFSSFASLVELSAWEDIIISLQLYEENIPIEATEQAAITLINLIPQVPPRQRRFLEPDPRRVAMGIVYRLLRRLPTEDARLNAIRVIWPELHTLSEKWRLLSWVEPGDDPENQLLGASGSSQIEVALREEIRNAPSAMLATEDALFWLLKWMKDVTPPSEPPLSLHLTPLLACALIRAAIYKEEFHKSDQSAVQVKKRVLWEFLVENIGSQEAVIEAVNTCKLAKSDQVLQEAIQLIEQSLSELNLSTTK